VAQFDLIFARRDQILRALGFRCGIGAVSALWLVVFAAAGWPSRAIRNPRAGARIIIADALHVIEELVGN